MTLSATVTLIVEKFLPDSSRKYLFLNYKQSDMYGTYKSFVPSYLQARPRSVILHCLERHSKALKYISSDVTVFDETTGKFEVKGSSEKRHTVFLEDPSCTCRDWTEWNLPCKHFFCIFVLYPQWNWDCLPDQYTKSAYLSTDQAALNSYFSPSVDQDAALHDSNVDSSNDDISELPPPMDGYNEEIPAKKRSIPIH
ncbi:uncharacterized protein [Dysidea avara]|uniref:uncharacterized protein isoform X7 n=1 Tax=Dysidea avara TaxID=196820 RepID=UPI003327F75E